MTPKIEIKHKTGFSPKDFLDLFRMRILAFPVLFWLLVFVALWNSKQMMNKFWWIFLPIRTKFRELVEILIPEWLLYSIFRFFPHPSSTFSTQLVYQISLLTHLKWVSRLSGAAVICREFRPGKTQSEIWRSVSQIVLFYEFLFHFFTGTFFLPLFLIKIFMI